MHQRDDSNPYVAGCDYSEFQGGRIVLLKQIWRFSRCIGFERGIVADCATGGMSGNVGQQRLHATEQLVSSAGEQPSVATRVAAAQEVQMRQ